MPKIPLATRKNASLSLAAFLVIATAWWYSQQPSAPPPPPPVGDSTVVVDPPDTTTPPVACALNGGSGNAASSTCQPCTYTPPGPDYASISPSCVAPPPATCSLIGGSGAPGSGTCQPCGYNPPGAAYATTAVECVAPPPPTACTLHYGTGTPGSSTCQPCPYNPPGQLFSTQAPTCLPPATPPPDTTPAPPDTTSAPSGMVGPAAIAELPRSIPSVVYPTGLTTQTVVPAGANLQTYINAATPGTELLLTPGAVYVGNFTLPNKGNNQSWIVIRTNTTLPVITSRMTPAVAAVKNLASICTNNTAPALSVALSANHYWLSGVKICGQSGFNGGNVLFKIGDSGGNGLTSRSLVPHHITLERSWVTVPAAVNVRRNILINGENLIIYSNYIENCHDGGGDSQCLLGYNGTRYVLIENNDLIGAHEIVMMGGSDPADSSLSPSDVKLSKNHIWRPSSWYGHSPYPAGTWPVKNFIETKNIYRYWIVANVFENDWSDAQQFGFVFKSENQDGTAPYTTTTDLTMEYNLIVNLGSGWNVSGQGSSSNPVVTGARFYIHDNWIRSGWQVNPYTSTGIVLQTLGGLKDLIFAHNSINNPISTNQFMSMDAPAAVNQVIHSNIVYAGTYGVKGSGQSPGTASLNTFAPGGVFQYNALIGAGCGSYPATQFCPAGWPTTYANGYDGKPIGADTAAVLAKTSGVVVAATPTTSILIQPGQSIQSYVNNYPAGTTFILQSGTYNQQTITPKDSMTFQGEVGTVLDGQNVAQFAFKGYNGTRWINGVKLRNLQITRYTAAPQNGAIWGGDDQTNSTSGWLLDSVDVGYSGNIGIRVGNRMRVLRSKTHNNGTLGIGGVGVAVYVDSLESSYNNNGCTNNPGFESGGSKFVLTDSLTVRRSYWHHNCGVGLWLDISNIHYVLDSNRVEDNIREGIVSEISYAGKISNNSVARNGWPTDPFRANGWAWDAGIGVHASSDVEVYNNTLDENFNGIVAIQQARTVANGDTYAPAGGYLVQNLNVHNNTIYQRTYPVGNDGGFAGGAVQDVSDNSIFTSRNNVWQNNTYYLGSNPAPFAWSNSTRTRLQWQSYSQDTGGTFNP